MLSPYFFLAGIENVEYFCDKCVSCSGSYVQKYRVCPLRLPVFRIFAFGTVIDVAYRSPKCGPCESSYSEVLKSVYDMTDSLGSLFPKFWLIEWLF
jgi:hypothetical protein